MLVKNKFYHTILQIAHAETCLDIFLQIFLFLWDVFVLNSIARRTCRRLLAVITINFTRAIMPRYLWCNASFFSIAPTDGKITALRFFFGDLPTINSKLLCNFKLEMYSTWKYKCRLFEHWNITMLFPKKAEQLGLSVKVFRLSSDSSCNCNLEACPAVNPDLNKTDN